VAGCCHDTYFVICKKITVKFLSQRYYIFEKIVLTDKFFVINIIKKYILRNVLPKNFHDEVLYLLLPLAQFGGGHGGHNMRCPPSFSLQVLYLEKFQKQK